jgi:hypothetical protein
LNFWRNFTTITSSAEEVKSKGYIRAFFEASLTAGDIAELFEAVQNGLNEFMVSSSL